MARVFTVRWPIFARLEAVLFFPVSLMLAGEITPIQTLVDRGLMPSLWPLAARFGVPWQSIVTISTSIVMLLAYFACLIITDRFLTVRKGYAALSIAAIGLWALVAMHLWGQVVAYLPVSDPAIWERLLRDAPPEFMASLNGMPPQKTAAIVAAGLAFLLHLRPIWIGLLDQGEVAMRLIMHRAEAVYARTADGQMHRPHDIWLRQSEEFRGWQSQQRLSAIGGLPRENPTVKVLYAVTWIGVMIGMFAAFHAGNHATQSQPAVAESAPPRSGRGVTTMAPDNPDRMPINPSAQGHDMHALTPAVMPAVQRPGEPIGPMAANVHTAPNEAVADRGADGSFVFSVEVNGETLRMIFDTGASVVALRSEDAAKVGIDLDRLRYTARTKTANGTAEMAPVIIDTITIGNITQHNVPGFVAKQGMLQENLLGQTFLARLAKYNVENNHLVLTGK
jgi:clan AA aspartic protease (TIGR02281 family)